MNKHQKFVLYISIKDILFSRHTTYILFIGTVPNSFTQCDLTEMILLQLNKQSINEVVFFEKYLLYFHSTHLNNLREICDKKGCQ